MRHGQNSSVWGGVREGLSTQGTVTGRGHRRAFRELMMLCFSMGVLFIQARLVCDNSPSRKLEIYTFQYGCYSLIERE